MVACQCTLVANDNFYYVRVVSQRLSNFPSSRFCVPTRLSRLCTTLANVNMYPFAESSFWDHALYLFRILFPRQERLTNPRVDNLLYFEIVKVKDLFASGNTAQTSEFRTYYCAWIGLNSVLIHSHLKSLHRFQ